MTKNEWMMGAIGLLIGIVLTVGYGVNYFSRHHESMGIKGGGMPMSMDDMTTTLKGKTGDDFDKEFIATMIVHHEGAVDMAEEAKKNAKHDEIKNLAEDIIAAQNREINDMRSWYQTWYGASVESQHSLHHQ